MKRKPTSKAGSANDFIMCCQHVQVCIQKKCESSFMGGDSEESGSDDQGGAGMDGLIKLTGRMITRTTFSAHVSHP